MLLYVHMLWLLWRACGRAQRRAVLPVASGAEEMLNQDVTDLAAKPTSSR